MTDEIQIKDEIFSIVEKDGKLYLTINGSIIPRQTDLEILQWMGDAPKVKVTILLNKLPNQFRKHDSKKESNQSP